MGVTGELQQLPARGKRLFADRASLHRPAGCHGHSQ